MKLLLVAMILSGSVSHIMGQEAKPPVVEKEAKAKLKPSIVFQGKTYILGDDVSMKNRIIVNRYYREGSGPGKLGAFLLQRFIMTKDDAKKVATKTESLWFTT